MKVVGYLAAFALGAGVATVVTHKVVSAKYDKLIEEEIESVKESLGKNSRVDISEKTDEIVGEALHPDTEIVDKPHTDVIREEYEAMIDEKYNTVTKQTDIPREAPYEITEEEYGEIYDYNAVSLTYYSDGILADDMDNPVDDIKETIGDILDRVDHYETVYVRNDVRGCDYEVYFDKDKWADTYERAMEE